MALSFNGAEAFTGTLTSTNNGQSSAAATGETAVTVLIAAGTTIAADTTNKASGTTSYRITPASGAITGLRTPALGAVSGAGAADAAFYYGSSPTVPSVEVPLLNAQTAASAILFTVNWLPTGFIRLRSTSATNLWTSTVAFAPTSFLRVALAVKIDTATPTNSQVRAAVYALNSNTPITNMDSGWVSAAPSNTGAGLDKFVAGRPAGSTDANAFSVDDFRWDPAATDIISAAAALAVTGAVTPNTAVTGVQRTLTLTATGGNGNPITFGPVDWGDGLTADSAVTQGAGVNTAIFTRIPTTAGASKTWSAPWSQA